MSVVASHPPRRSLRPQLPEFPALEGSVPATLLVHKARE